MSSPSPMLSALTLALLLAGCGRGADDTLVDGAVDRPRDGNSQAAAEDVGPPSVPSAAASPSAARTGTETASGGTAAPAAGSPATSGAMLRLAQGAHGAHLVDSSGAALYMLEGDRTGDRCTADCLQAWPPVLITNVQPSAEAGLQGAMVSTTTRPDGSRQVTYNGHPLYRHAGGAGAGNTSGHGLKDRYGTWSLVSPQGARVAHGGAGG